MRSVAPTGGDFVSVRGQNSAHNKIDAYLDRTIAVHAIVDRGTGMVRSTVTVTLHNRAPAVGLPPYVIGNDVDQPPGTNQMTLAVYSPLHPTGATIDGVFAPVGPEQELGWNVGSLRIVVPPGRTTTVVFALEGTLDLADGYRLRVVPQPAATTTRATVEVEGAAGWVAEAGLHLTRSGRTATGSATLLETQDFQADIDRSG